MDVSGRILTCVGEKGVEINNGCNSLNLLGLYGGFIIAYPGPWKKQILFLLIGRVSNKRRNRETRESRNHGSIISIFLINNFCSL